MFCSVQLCSVLFSQVLFSLLQLYFIMLCSVLFCSAQFSSVLFSSVELSSAPQRWGTTGAEIKAPPGGSPGLSKVPSQSKPAVGQYSCGCCACLQGFYTCLVSAFPTHSISFSPNVSKSLTVECVLEHQPSSLSVPLQMKNCPHERLVWNTILHHLRVPTLKEEAFTVKTEN